MSVHEHKGRTPDGPAQVQVIVVSSTRTLDDDVSGQRIVELVQGAGHKVAGRGVVADDKGRIQSAVRAAVATGLVDVVILTGGTGISARDVTPEAVRELFDREVVGFGELFRALSFSEVGSAAMLSRATAGLFGPCVVFALPGSQAAVELAMERLVLPELDHLRVEIDKEGPLEDAVTETVEAGAGAATPEPELDLPALPPPSGSLGRLGHGSIEVTGVPMEAPPPPDDGEEELPERGWKRAVYELEGEILSGRYPDLPPDVERHAPVMNVLETAGEHKVMKLPNGVKFTLYGWPDLLRPSSKVLAIGWGEPYAEILALHRYPVQTGLCIEEIRGLLPKRGADIERVATEVTGRAPRDTSGKLFALQGDAIWIERGGSVVKWDGRRETTEGSTKMAIASLVLSWANR